MSAHARRRILVAAALTAVAALTAAPGATAASPTPGPGAHPTGTPSARPHPTGTPTSGVVTPSPRARRTTAPPAPAFTTVPVPSPASADNPVTVTVTTLEPRAPTTSAQYLQVSGQLVNAGTQPLTLLQVRLGVGAVLGTRSELTLADTEPPPTVPVGVPVEPPTTSLAPGEQTTFDLRLHVGELGMSRLGAYPLQIKVRAVVGSETRRTTVGQASTYLPWFAGMTPARTRLAWLVPVVDQPSRAPREDMVTDRLASELAAGGRLQRLLHGATVGAAGACDPRAQLPPGVAVPAGPGPCQPTAVPVTYAVDPDLLFSVEAMTRPYNVAAPDGRGRSTAGSGTDAARTWLAGLRAEARHSPVVALPFADPDVVALSRTSALRDELTKTQRLGTETTGRVLGITPLAGVAWPPAGRLTPASLDALVDGGASSVVLDELALPTAPSDDSRTPGARALLPATNLSVSGLVVDDALSHLLQPGTDRWQGARLAEQRWLVETAIIAAERPSESRTLLVAPPRQADLLPAVLAPAMQDTGRVPWLCPVSLTDAAGGREVCPGSARPAQPRPPEFRGALEPADDASGELPRSFLDALANVRADSDQFTDSVLVPNNTKQAATKARLLRARARAESSAWRTAPQLGRAMLHLLADDVADLRGKVQVTAGRRVTLTSDTGTIRVSVVNRLDQPVTVGVELEASNQARLSTTRTPVVQVPPGVSQQISATAHTSTSGQFVVVASLLDREGHPFGSRAQFVVRSTHYGRVALAVTGLGVGVLLVAAGVRITRRALGRGGRAG